MKNKTNETLASMVIVYRVLGILKIEAKSAMVEILKRKSQGSDFDFDKFIEDGVLNCKQEPVALPPIFGAQI